MHFCMKNGTTVDHIILLAFSGSRKQDIVLSVVFLSIYILIIVGNGVIIFIVCVDQCLQKPMYFFLANFSGMEICYATVFMPKMITNLVTGFQSISLFQCMVQLYLFISFGVSELFLLAVMAYDRYQAICNPLVYTIIMNSDFCISLQLGCWLSSFIFNLPLSLLLLRLDFSGKNVIKHFMCDGAALVNLSCSDTQLNNVLSFILALATMLGSLILTSLSYFRVIYTILKLPTKSTRVKAFSTCSSHLTAAAIYYGTLLFMYARPQLVSEEDNNKFVSMFYTMIIPLINPIIYSLRNTEVKEAIRKFEKSCINKLYL